MSRRGSDSELSEYSVMGYFEASRGLPMVNPRMSKVKAHSLSPTSSSLRRSMYLPLSKIV